MFKKILISNRGAVTSRVARTLRKLGVASVAIYSEADAELKYVSEADQAFPVGPSPARQSYLDQDRIIAVAKQAGADALHPGYGFLSENQDFAAAVEAAGIRFIGPRPVEIEKMGHKSRAREILARHGMPMAPSSSVLPVNAQAALAAARAIGWPVMIKPAGGGGGIGMIAAHDEASFLAGFARAGELAARLFGNADLYVERLIERPRHVEFQIMADRHGAIRHLYERDCSVQRRHQKVIEESPAPGLEESVLPVAERIVGTLREVGYSNVGTVEMLRDTSGAYHFLEMNTRLQVEHAVTEETTGVDIVAAQLRLAAGETLDSVIPTIGRGGHAVQARVYAEDPIRFLPSAGPLNVFRPPAGEGIRVETGYRQGNAVTPHYDPMIALVVATAADRRRAIARLAEALGRFEVAGVKTNIPFLQTVLASHAFLNGDVHTGLASDLQQAARKAS